MTTFKRKLSELQERMSEKYEELESRLSERDSFELWNAKIGEDVKKCWACSDSTVLGDEKAMLFIPARLSASAMHRR